MGSCRCRTPPPSPSPPGTPPPSPSPQGAKDVSRRRWHTATAASDEGSAAAPGTNSRGVNVATRAAAGLAREPHRAAHSARNAASWEGDGRITASAAATT